MDNDDAIDAELKRRAEQNATDWYKKLGSIRRNAHCLKEGDFIPYSAMLSCVAYKRQGEGETMFVIANRNFHEINYYLPEEFRNKPELLQGGYTTDKVTIPAYGAAIIIS